MSIVDLNHVSADPFAGKQFDFCICGSGPAGMTLALKLGRKHSVCLLEAGAMQYTQESQDNYKGTSTGKSYFPLDACRLRYFGGSSGHWGGACRPLDEEDFKKKPFVEYSGWPIEKKDLDPYLMEARDILDIDPEVSMALPPCDERWLPKFPEYRETRFWLSKPTRFGDKYRGEIAGSDNIHCFINANVTDIRLDDDHRAIRSFEVTNYRGQRFASRAKVFILAAGGLENPRIMLNANRQIPQGIGNENGLVGRFFTDHPHQHLGEYVLEDAPHEECANDQIYWHGPPHGKAFQGHFFKPTRDFQQSHQVLNYALSISPSGVMPKPRDSSFKRTLRKLLCSNETFRETAEWLKNGAVSCFDEVDGVINIQSEQEPNPDSRITLASENDAFGLPRLNMHWQFTDLDRFTIRDAAWRAAERFATAHTGRVRLERWLHPKHISIPGFADHTASIVAGPHHMCTTRMSDSPATGVVDKHCKVFGIDNFYIGGSSVFSTGGFSNPTFTIIQLALRMADHLEARLAA